MPRQAARSWGAGDQDRHGPPAIGRVGRHGEHGGDGGGFQQAFGDAGGDAGPLRAGCGSGEAGAEHGLEGAEMQLVRAGRVAGAAVDPGFGRGIVGLDELAGGGAGLCVGHAGDAAIGAQASGGGVSEGHSVAERRAAPVARGQSGSAAARMAARSRRWGRGREAGGGGLGSAGAEDEHGHGERQDQERQQDGAAAGP